MKNITREDIEAIRNGEYTRELERKLENICRTGIAMAIKATHKHKGEYYKNYLGIAYSFLYDGINKELDYDKNVWSYLVGRVYNYMRSYFANQDDESIHSKNKKFGIVNESELIDEDFESTDDGSSVYDRLFVLYGKETYERLCDNISKHRGKRKARLAVNTLF